MADLALGGLERIVRACLAIKDAVETVRENRKECRGIQRCVDTVTDLLSCLKEVMVHHPAFMRPLDDLAESLEEALELVTDCQQRSALRHLLGAGDMAKKLRRVQDDVQRKLGMVILATNVLNLQISVSVTESLHYVGAHPLLLQAQAQAQAQVAGEVNSYDSNLSAIEMRPGLNSNTTTVATGNAEPYASSPRLTNFNSSMRESALHLSSEENISQGGHAFVKMQKIVIKVAWYKAIKLVAAAAGVYSIKIAGDARDQMEVVGEGLDCVSLVSALRKKIGAADLLMVSDVPPSGSNGELLARQSLSDPSSSSGPSLDPEESPPSPPRPASFMGKGKQTLPPVAQPHHLDVMRPPVAAPAQPDGPPISRGNGSSTRRRSRSKTKSILSAGGTRVVVGNYRACCRRNNIRIRISSDPENCYI